MSNSYFEFKQFTVNQDITALKVGTDAVLLGAWTSVGSAQTVLDIGTGTGILSLMMAQKCSACFIDAIEIEPNAAKQAAENFLNSKWANRLHVFHLDFLEFNTSKKYDLIISNPPYFHHHKTNNTDDKTLARHANSLNFRQLIDRSVGMLSPDGVLALVFPAEAFDQINAYAAAKMLYPKRCLWVRPTARQEIKRMLVEFTTVPFFFHQECLVIETSRHEYTSNFRELTQDFYLEKVFR